MFENVKRVDFGSKLPTGFNPKENPPFNINFPIESGFKQAQHRMLVVVGHVATEDLKAGGLLKDPMSKDVLRNILNMSISYTRQFDFKVPSYKYAVVNFNFFKTYNLSGTQWDLANQLSAKRVLRLIEQLDPTMIVVFGDIAAQSILQLDTKEIRYKRGYKHKLTYNDKQYPVVTTIDYSDTYTLVGEDVNDEDDSEGLDDKLTSNANIVGYISRTLSTAFAGKMIHRSRTKPKYVYVDTIKKFDAALEELRKHKYIGCDTETESLDVYDNKVLTVQLSYTEEFAYVIPVFHKDSPFTAGTLDHVLAGLRDFFGQRFTEEKESSRPSLVGQNLKFDLRVLRQNLNLPIIWWNIYDIMAGEHALDENQKILQKHGTKVWDLLRITCSYGNYFYLDASFSKDDRVTIKDHALDDDVLRYASMDAQVPLEIRKLQLERADKQQIGKYESYRKHYSRFHSTVLTCTIQSISSMEERGTFIDIKHMQFLLSKKSPLRLNIVEVKEQLRNSPNVQKANALLLERNGIPANGLFGDNSGGFIFDMNSPIHKKALFFDVMNLEAVSFGKSRDADGNKNASTDKFFQKEHADVLEVQLLTKLAGNNKLFDTYVKGFFTRIAQSHDGKRDHCLRPGFGFMDVVTGRSNSFNPNLQNIPQRSKEAKYIKRMFATIFGKLKFKVDYSAHEVRCIHLDNYVDTELGKIKLGDLIELDAPPRVKSFNHATGNIEYQQIGYRSKHTTSENMLEIAYEGGSIWVTENHKVWSNTRNCYIEAQHVTADEDILVDVGD